MTRPAPPAHLSEAARAHLAELPPYAHPTLPDPTDHDGWRALVEQYDAMLTAGTPERLDGLACSSVTVDGVTTYVLQPDAVDTGVDPGTAPIYLEIHGGGLFLGGGDLARRTAHDIASVNGMLTWAPDYRMPPDHPYPAALDDCLAVYRAILAVREPASVFVGGTSAGGNLAAALVARAVEEGLPTPAALVLLSPELDLTESGDSFSTLLGLDVMTSVRNANLLYADGHDLAHPRLSPLFTAEATLAAFPPTFLQAGTRDLMLSNAVRMHARLCAAGVRAELHVGEAMPHGGFGGRSPEDLHLRRMVRLFLDRHRHDQALPDRSETR